MRLPVAPLALAALLAAGCLSGPAPAAPAPVGAEPAPSLVPLVWDLTDCEAITWEVPVPASRLSARLPEGFAPMPAAPAASTAPGGLDQLSLLGFEAIECAAGFGSSQTAARSVPFARIYTPVIPPREDSDHRAGTQHAFVWAAAVADDAWRDRLAAAGLPVHDGGTLVGPSAQGYSGRMALDGVGIFSFTGRSDASEQDQADQAVRDFTPAAGGLAAWVGTREAYTTAGGAGLWEASSGSWVADVLGATKGAAAFRHERYTIPHEAVIRPGSSDGEPFMGPVDE